MSVYKRDNSRWYFRTQIKLPSGKTVRLNGTTPKGIRNNKKATEHAERIAILNALNPGSAQWQNKGSDHAQSTAIPTIAEYISDYLKVISEDGSPMGRLAKKRHLESDILVEFGHLRLSGLRQRDIDTYKTRLLKGTKKTKTTKGRAPVSIKTVNNILAPLGTLLRYAVRNNEIEGFNLVLNFREPESELDAISSDDFEKLLAACSDLRYRVALLLGRNAGLRIGEIRSLRWCDVDEKKGRITVRSSYDTRNNLKSTKNGKIRHVPLSGRVSEALKQLNPFDAASWAGKSTIIQHQKLRKPLSYWAMRDKVLDLYKTAGVEVPDLPWHCLRHAFCTELAEAGVPIHTIKELAGHSSIETTLRYMHTGEKAKLEAIAQTFGSSCHKNATSHSPKREKPSN